MSDQRKPTHTLEWIGGPNDGMKTTVEKLPPESLEIKVVATNISYTYKRQGNKMFCLSDELNKAKGDTKKD